MKQTRFVIEIVNHINDTVKCAFIDHHLGVAKTSSLGLVGCQSFSVFPLNMDEKDKDFILNKIKNSQYRVLPDGSRLLPETISSLGAITLPKREVDFTVAVYEVCRNQNTVSSINFKCIEHFKVKGIEGKGNGFRHETHYQIDYFIEDKLKAA